MEFANNAERMRKELELTHPDLRHLLEEFDQWSQKRNLPPATLTQLWRTPQEMVDIYVPYWKGLIQKLSTGQPLLVSERQQAHNVQGMDDTQLTSEALKRFSWHLVRCAADIRTKHYSAEQLSQVRGFFAKLTSPQWESLVHDVHGNHQHVGRRDFSWRARFDPRPNAGTLNGNPGKAPQNVA